MNDYFIKCSLQIFILITVCFFPSLAYGAKSEEFTRALANKIYFDCVGKEIIAKEDSMLGAIIYVNNPTFQIESGTPPVLTLNNDLSLIIRVIRHLTELEPYITYSNYPIHPIEVPGFLERNVDLDNNNDGINTRDFSNSGLGIIACGQNILDINNDQYFWNKTLFELPKISNTYKFFENGVITIRFTLLEITLFGSIFGTVSIIILIRKLKKSSKRI